MARVARPIRGFLVHDALVDLDHLAPNTGGGTGSSYTHADPQPGSPVPGDPKSTLLPHVHHAQAADLDLLTTRAGIPRRGGIPASEGAALAYRVTGEEDDAYRGWNEPNLVVGYRPVEWSTFAQPWEYVTAVTIPSTQQVVAVGFRPVGTTGRAWTRDPATRTWSPDVAISAETYRLGCCFLISRIERVVAIGFNSGVLDAVYSDDAGNTWAPYATQLSTSFPSAFVDQIEAIEDRNGNVLLVFVNNATGDYEQWVSVDAGATFVQQSGDSGWAYSFHLSKLADGRILVTLVPFDADHAAAYLVLEDAFDLILGKVPVEFNGTATVDSVAVAVDADGVVYAYLQEEAFTVAGSQAGVWRSLDDAASFAAYDTPGLYTTRPSGLIGPNQDLTHHLLYAVAAGGEIVVLATPEYDPTTATPPDTDGSLVAITLGGWCSDEQPGLPFTGRLRRSSWGPGAVGSNDGSVWLPTQTFAYQGWDDTASGGPLEVDPLPNGYHRFTTVADVSWAQYGDNVFEDGATFFVEIACNGGTASDPDHGRARIARCDGINEAGVRIGLVSSEIRIRDYASNTLLAAAIPFDVANDLVQFLVVFVDLDHAAVYYKEPRSSLWTLIVEAPLTTQAETNIGNEIRVGTSDSAVSATVTVGIVALMYGPSTAARFLRGLTDTAFRDRIRWGKALGPQPYPLRDQVAEYSHAPVTFLSATGGAAREGESFSVPAVRDHDVSSILPQVSPSPARPWRSTDDAEQVLTWDLGADTRLGHSWALGLALIRTNFRAAVLEVRSEAGVETTLGTWDAAVGVGLSFVRSGAVVEPDAASGGVAPAFWPAGMLEFGHIIFDPNGSPVVREIEWNQGGRWAPGPGVKPVLRVRLLGGEPTSGTCHIVAASAVLVVHRSAPTAYRYVRIRIPAQNTVSAIREIGQVILGGLLIPGKQWSRGWSWRYAPRTDVDEDDYGTLWPTNRGPVRRELTVSWQDAQDESGFRRDPSGPYLAAGPGTPGLAAADDVQHQIAALLAETEGGSLPVVALADVPGVTGMVTDPKLLLYGLLTARPQFNNVQGDEARSEVTRGESITVREQV